MKFKGRKQNEKEADLFDRHFPPFPSSDTYSHIFLCSSFRHCDNRSIQLRKTLLKITFNILQNRCLSPSELLWHQAKEKNREGGKPPIPCSPRLQQPPFWFLCCHRHRVVQEFHHWSFARYTASDILDWPTWPNWLGNLERASLQHFYCMFSPLVVDRRLSELWDILM